MVHGKYEPTSNYEISLFYKLRLKNKYSHIIQRHTYYMKFIRAYSMFKIILQFGAHLPLTHARFVLMARTSA